MKSIASFNFPKYHFKDLAGLEIAFSMKKKSSKKSQNIR